MEGYEVAQGKKAWKPGWLLRKGVRGCEYGQVKERGLIGRDYEPVGDAGHDLGFNVLLDVGPRLAVLGGLAGQQLAQVAGLDGRDDIAGGEGVEVGDDW